MIDTKLTIKIFSIVLLFTLMASVSLARMNGNLYYIEADDLNIGGGISESASYKVNDSLGQTGGGLSASANYKIQAGYRSMSDIFISVGAPQNIALTPLSVTNNSAVGSTTWNVSTNSAGGYILSLKSSTENALADSPSGFSFTDYAENTPNTKEMWVVPDGSYEFGFSGRGGDTLGYGSDTNCAEGTDVPSLSLLWEGFTGATAIQLASSTNANFPAGTNTTLCVATEQKTIFAPVGTYTATIIATALAL